MSNKISIEEKLEITGENRIDKYVEIDKMSNNLISGSIAIILGLTGLTNEELKSRKDLYQLLYDVSKDGSNEPLLNIKWNLFNVQNSLSLPYDYYKTEVIQKKWEEGLIALKNFKLMIEVIRTHWKGYVDDDTKYDLIFIKLGELSTETNPNNVPIIFNDILAI